MIKGICSALVNMVHEYSASIFDKNVKAVQTVIFDKRHKYYAIMENMAEIELFEHYDAKSHLLAKFHITNLTVGAVADCISALVEDREKTIKAEEG